MKDPKGLTSNTGETKSGRPMETRRGFLYQVAGVASCFALPQLLGPEVAEAQAGSPPFANAAEIARRNTGILRAVMELRDTDRNIPGVGKRHLRYFQGWDPEKPGVKSPANAENVSPGPTLRADIGDKVEISFLNKISDSMFAYSIDTAPADKDNASYGCDASMPTNQVYPVADAYPNCFHGSSTANIHFHGTHTSPDGLADNVLVQVLPQTKQEDWDKYFETNLFKTGKIPQSWNEMPLHYRTAQEALIKAVDKAAEAQAIAAGRPVPEKLWDMNQHQIHAGMWPQYIAGAFPNFFQLPKYKKGGPYVMGQSPGTHWYHAHKHGSTALHILNGLAGAFIIEDNSAEGYDGKLKKFYPGLVQNVLVFQQIDPQQNLERANRNNPRTGSGRQLVNGQLSPTIPMQPGEVQLWRIVNATVGGNQGSISPAVFAALTAANFQLKQVAQDGVQLGWENYQSQPYLTGKIPGGMNLAAGNRVDLLVKAPNSPTATPVAIASSTNPVFFVNVTNTTTVQKGLITDEADYPKLPEFLGNLAAPTAKPRMLDFGWEDGRTGPGRNANNEPPHFMIDGKQFEQNGMVIDQCMREGDTEDWILENHTTVLHPFHIHINPFQVIRIESPVKDKPTTIYSAEDSAKDHPIWQDVINIPAGVINSDNTLVPGKVRIRHRFVDFTGTYVLHCHILAHEDRGMMQLVRVVTPAEYKKGCQIAIPMHH
jgi:FtsP/CotA-like multicopper oxidase with cupredoxin domain